MDKKLVCVEIRDRLFKNEHVTTELIEVESDDPQSLAELATEIERRFREFYDPSKTSGSFMTREVIVCMRDVEDRVNVCLQGHNNMRLLPKFRVSLGEPYRVAAI